MATEKRLDLIDRKELIASVQKKSFAIGADCHPYEAEPVVHGRWIPHNKGQNNWCECSECNTVGSPFWKRCPVCEAKMDGGEKDV